MNPLAAYDLTGRVAVVTGAASGIGAATSEMLAGCGASVVAADLDANGAEATAVRLREAGANAVAVAANVTKRGEVEAMVQRAVDEYGRLDIMCNVAGAMSANLYV